MLPKNHVLRKDYAKEFGKDATLVSYATLGKPAKRKRQEALDSAARVLKRPKDKAVRKEESFVTTTPFARLPYHDVTKHCLIDLAHTIGNLVKLLLGTVVNITSKNVAKFAKTNRTFEVTSLGRFRYLESTAAKKKCTPKWIASKKVWESIEQAQRKLQFPKEWPRPGKLFTKCNQLKTSELLLLAGPVGVYIFQQLDIDPAIRANMITILRLLSMLMRKISTPEDRRTIRRDLPVAITQLELHLPLYTQTSVMHCLVYHALDQLEATGPFHVGNMLDIERCFNRE